MTFSGSTMNPGNYMPAQINPNAAPLVRAMGSEDAEEVREVNTHYTYYKMKNKYGREVGVPPHLVAKKLAKGYTYVSTDPVTDNPADRTPSPEPMGDPAHAMAKVAQAMEKNLNVQNEILEEVVEIKRRGRPKKEVEEIDAKKAL